MVLRHVAGHIGDDRERRHHLELVRARRGAGKGSHNSGTRQTAHQESFRRGVNLKMRIIRIMSSQMQMLLNLARCATML
jgi:hypothetical protein